MLDTLAVVAILIAVAIAVILVLAAGKPNTFSVRRETTVSAPPEKIFPLINDFHQWGAWSPYEGKDPGMKRTYSGAPSGKGAVYAWEGNKNVGSGRMEILEAPFVSKLMQVFMSLDKMIGKDFEAGLANLQKLAER
ncbi:MAG: SRPBCC family protein [Bradyrhizobium sp.]|nr:SRPBCC family protein [Bradyrhizobium sp.]